MTLLMREREIAEENFAKGIEQGIEKVIANHINSLKEFNVPEEKIIDRIMVDYNLTKEDVKKYL